MDLVVQVMLPIFLLLLLGYLSVAIRLLTSEQIKAFSLFVIKIALPAFLLNSLSSKTFGEIWSPQYFLVYATGSLLMFVLTYVLYRKVFRDSMTQAAVMAMGGSMSNTGFIGTAVLTALLGAHAAIYLSLTLIVENIMILSMMLILAEAGQQESQGFTQLFQKTLTSLLKNPIVLSILFGILMVLLDVHLPAMLGQVLKSLGSTASPIALFVIGGSLYGANFRAFGRDSLILPSIKLLLMPIVIFVGLSMMPGVPAEMLFAGTLLAALSMPIAFGIFGQIFELNERALGPLVISTILAFISLSCLIHFWPVPVASFMLQ